MTSPMKIAASLALVCASALGLSACSSGSAAATSASSAAASIAASAPASAAASSAASTAPVNIAPEVISAYFKSVCLAPAAKMGVDGALSADGKICTTPAGKDVSISQITTNLGDSRARFALMANYYSIADAKDIDGCLTMAEAKKAMAAPTPSLLSDTCVSNLMKAVAESLSKK